MFGNLKDMDAHDGRRASFTLVRLIHAVWHPLRGAGFLWGGVDRGWLACDAARVWYWAVATNLQVCRNRRRKEFGFIKVSK